MLRFFELVLEKCQHCAVHMTSVLTVMCLVCSSGACVAFQEEPDAMIEYLLQGHAANFESFAFIQTRFTLTRAYFDDLTDGLEGRWLEEPQAVASRVFWAFHDGNFRRSETFSDEVVAKHTRQEGTFTVRRYSNTNFCWNSTLQLDAQKGQIFQVRTKAPDVEGFQPFNLGLGHDVLRERATWAKTQHKGQVRYLGERELNGRRLPVLEFQMHFEPPTLQIEEIWIDPEHGYLPLRIDTFYETKSKPTMTTRLLEFKELSNGRWIPALYRYVEMEHKRGWEMKLDEVDADNPPSPEIFVMRYPEDTEWLGHNNITNENYLARRRRVSLASFRSDGTLRPDQDELEFNTSIGAASAVMAPPGTAPDQRLSELSPWPFESPQFVRRVSWVLVALAAGLILLVLVLRKRSKAS